MCERVIAINGRRRVSEESAETIRALIDELKRRTGREGLVLKREFADALERLGVLRPGELEKSETFEGERVGLVLSIGGDGTFLRTARWVAPSEVPILGINNGHLGYLTDIDLAEAPGLADALISGELQPDARRMLEVITEGGHGGPTEPYALNEVAVLRDATASMITIDTRLDGHALARYPADGLVVSTPTGSTAYNLSVGGPLIAPMTGAFVVSPVAPHALTMRPIVVPDTSEVEMRVESRTGHFRLALDGRSETLPEGVIVRVRRADFRTIIARRPGRDFADTLRTKLLWGVDPR